MNSQNDIEWVNFFVPSLKSPLTDGHIPARELAERIKTNDGAESYHGVFELEERISFKNYQGLMRPALNLIRFDFDSKVDGGMTAFDDTKKFVTWLNIQDLNVYFSGNKGFHVEVPSPYFGLLPSVNLNLSLEQLCKYLKTIYPTIDTTVYSPNQKFRVPGSVHPKSLRFKMRLTKIDLQRDLDEIKDLAKEETGNLDILDIDPFRFREPLPQIINAIRESQYSSSIHKDGTWLQVYTGNIATLEIVSLVKEAGLYVKHLTGNIHVVNCPWRNEHSENTDGTSSTVVFEKSDTHWAGFKCHHDHCSERGLSDFLEKFNTNTVSKHCERIFEPQMKTIGTPCVPRLAEEAFYGLAGKIVRLIEPHTESDPVALLLQLLAVVGNVVGRTAYFPVEQTRHYLNIFIVLVGRTSKARKGTALNHILSILESVDDGWSKFCVQSGLASGEGLIYCVRDPVEKVVDGIKKIEDQGIADKRLMVVQSEFGSTLKILSREGNSLSGILRDAWDKGNLSNLTKNSPLRTTNAHISIIGHTTREELLRNLTETESANGFGNRILWLDVKRSKTLPDGGNISEVNFDAVVSELKEAVEFAKNVNGMQRNVEAQKLWHKVYVTLGKDVPGIVGALTARAEAQVTRLSIIFAILDKTNIVTPLHLNAALAIWKFSEESCKTIFGSKIGDNVADKILAVLRATTRGLTRTEIRDLFHRNHPKNRIDSALKMLSSQNIAYPTTVKTDGRDIERWFAASTTKTTETTTGE